MKNKTKKKSQISLKNGNITNLPINFCGQNIFFSYSLSFYIILTTLLVDNLILKFVLKNDNRPGGAAVVSHIYL